MLMFTLMCMKDGDGATMTNTCPLQVQMMINSCQVLQPLMLKGRVTLMAVMMALLIRATPLIMETSMTLVIMDMSNSFQVHQLQKPQLTTHQPLRRSPTKKWNNQRQEK